jgi:hypothetical protein
LPLSDHTTYVFGANHPSSAFYHSARLISSWIICLYFSEGKCSNQVADAVGESVNEDKLAGGQAFCPVVMRNFINRSLPVSRTEPTGDPYHTTRHVAPRTISRSGPCSLSWPLLCCALLTCEGFLHGSMKHGHFGQARTEPQRWTHGVRVRVLGTNPTALKTLHYMVLIWHRL